MKLRLALLLLVACRSDGGQSHPDAANNIVDAPKQVDAAAADAAVDAPPTPVTPTTRIWVRGDILTDNQDVAASFGHPATGLPFGPMNAPAMKIMNARVLDVRGDKIAYVADTTTAGRFDLIVANADNTSPITVLEGATNIEITALTLSPDGTKVAFTMDSVALNNGYDLYVAPTTAAATAVRVSPDRATVSVPVELDVFTQFTWSADSKYLAFSGDLTENAYDQAYVVDTTAATPTAVVLLARNEIATQAMGAQGLRGGLQFDSNNNIYFRARVDMNSTAFKLFTATPAGSKSVFALPARGDASTADASAFLITPGDKMVFSADAPTIGQFDLYVATLPTGTPTKLTTLTAVGEPQFTAPMVLSPDGMKVALIADYLGGDGNYEPFVVHLDGSTQTPRRLISSAATCPNCQSIDAEAVIWNKEGTAIYALGDFKMNNDSRLYLVDPAMTDQTPTLAVTTPVSGDIFQIFAKPL